MEAQEINAEGDRIIAGFLVEVLPALPEEKRHLAGDLIVTTMTAVGKEISERARTDAEIATYAEAMSDMFIRYLSYLGNE